MAECVCLLAPYSANVRGAPEDIGLRRLARRRRRRGDSGHR